MSRLLVTGIFAAMTAATAMTVSEAARDAISDPHARSWAVVGAFSYFVFVRAPSRQPSRNAVALIACTVAVAAVVLLQKPAEDGSAALVVAGDVVALASCAWLLISVSIVGLLCRSDGAELRVVRPR